MSQATSDLDLVGLITATDAATRDTALEEACRDASLDQLFAAANELERFRWQSDSLYERVRALMFLHALHRYHIPARPELRPAGVGDHAGYDHLLRRRFEEAIASFKKAIALNPQEADAYDGLAAIYEARGKPGDAKVLRARAEEIRRLQAILEQ